VRGAGQEAVVEAVAGEDFVRLKVVNGPELVLHPDSLRELLASQQGETPAQARAASDPSLPTRVEVPARFAWRGLGAGAGGGTRAGGEVLQVVLDTFEVVKGGAAQWAGEELRDLVDGQVDAGLYALQRGKLEKLKEHGAKLAPGFVPPGGGKDLLVLLHGTFSETAGTFGKLWEQHAAGVAALFDNFGDRVYGFDHATLGESPLANALRLARVLPDDTVLHLLSHSRGGLVAETLARACAREPAAEELALLNDSERSALGELRDVVRSKRVSVARVVRVACPARGTTLAGKRLDAYLSVLRWALELSGVPVAPALVDFLQEIARQRTDVDTFPGLAAMMPASSLVQWLHAEGPPIPGELRVVAGDVTGDSVWSWVKTLASDAFFWTDNDFVVQTRSMYGGSLRGEQRATFLLDRGGKVSHFGYFSHATTADAVVNGLTLDAPPGFGVIGPRSYAGADSSGVRSGALDDPRERPAVFVLPGILGSNLRYDHDRIWVGLRFLTGFKKLAYDPADTHVHEDGPFDPFYAELLAYLAVDHHALGFAFDWRKPIEGEARLLAQKLEEALEARKDNGQPVWVIAHSMGGLVMRCVEWLAPATWRRFMDQPQARFLMLGTPNGGSWKPMRVLTGDDALGNGLAFAGDLFDPARARGLMAAFPGFLQLQAGLDSSELGTTEGWEELAAFDRAELVAASPWHAAFAHLQAWGIPSGAALDDGRKLAGKLAAQNLGKYGKQILLIVGRAQWTTDGFKRGTGGIEYSELEYEGDGTVLHRSACVPGVRTFELDAEHGDLARQPRAFASFLKLLESGELPAQTPVKPFSQGVRGTARAALAPVQRLVRPARDALPLRPDAGNDALTRAGAERKHAQESTGLALSVRVVNGHLKFVRQPLLLGHYRSMRLTGTEDAIDRLIGHGMRDVLRTGNYPDVVGSNRIFPNRQAEAGNSYKLPMPEAAIVVGLGEEGELDGAKLAQAIEKAVLSYAQRLVESRQTAPAQFELAATLLGSGGANMSVSTSARAVVRGVRAANAQLVAVGWPLVSALSLIELFLERAVEAWRALDSLRSSASGVITLKETVERGAGGMLRPLESKYRGANYDFVTVSTVEREATSFLQYTLDTHRARAEVQAQALQPEFVAELASAAGSHTNRDDALARTLFDLLVPVELEPYLVGASRLVLQLDRAAASMPWELLDRDGDDGSGEPWALRCQLIRKLRTEEFRHEPVGAGRQGGILVIGAPQCPANYADLPGARAEARAVAQALTRSDGEGLEPKVLLDQDGITILSALLGRPYRIVHVAGHGAPGRPADPSTNERARPPGIVLDGTKLLSSAELRCMRNVPELVFVNCCFLAEIPDGLTLESRAAFASGVAEELIMLGVRCVVAAGWAVDDMAALEFATTFYRSILNGSRFVEAVTAARGATWKKHPQSNTWAAYQCYGDPDWTWSTSQTDDVDAVAFETIVSSVGLQTKLQALTSEVKYEDKKPERIRDELNVLAALHQATWGDQGEVAEAFAEAYTAAALPEQALAWYDRALRAPDGRASFRSLQQRQNILVREAEKYFAALEPARRKLEAPAVMARIESAVAALGPLQTLVASKNPRDLETLSVVGSAKKRLALIAQSIDALDESARFLREMGQLYTRALELGVELDHDDLYYPGGNALLGHVIDAFGTDAPAPLAPQLVAAIEASIDRTMRLAPDFWPAITRIELRIYQALNDRRLAAELDAIQRALEDLKERVQAPWYWKSPRDQARLYVPLYSAACKDEQERQAAAALLTLLAGLGP
jgi:hypothetical protein